MIYIISGASRSGKTLIARKMMKKCGIPYLSLDWLVMGFTNGIPEYGIHDKLWPDEIAERFWSYFRAMLESMIWLDEDYIIEGEAVLPGLIHELQKKHPEKLRICFVGYAHQDIEDKVKQVYAHSRGTNDWLTKEPKAYVEDHIGNMVEYSARIEKACNQYGLKYIDTSNDFLQTLEEAIQYLLRSSDTP